MSSSPSTHICNVFSLEEKADKVSSALSIRQFTKKTYWFVDQDSQGSLTIQALNEKYLPVGDKKTISTQKLQQNYIAEPQFYYQKVKPKLHALKQAIKNGDAYRSKKEHFSAELEYDVALNLDEKNIRANFGAGIIYLSLGETLKAANIFNRLVQMEGTFTKEHKHLFNEFGISLRKNNMHKQAVEYYERALRLADKDENLHVNIARPLFATGQLPECLEHLFKALRLAPSHVVGLKFLAWLQRGGYIPEEMRGKVRDLLASYPPEDILPKEPRPGTFVLPDALRDERLPDEIPPLPAPNESENPTLPPDPTTAP